MVAASTRCEAVTANHAATRIGPTSVPAGASAASTRDPARNSATGGHHARRRPVTPRAVPPPSIKQNQIVAPTSSAASTSSSPRAGGGAATGHEEVRIGLARQDRSPPGLRLAGPDPGREGHGAHQVQRRCRGNTHHLAVAVEPQRTTESALRRPGRSDNRAGVALPEASAATVPEPLSRAYAATRPAAREGGALLLGVDISARTSAGLKTRS